MNHAPESTERTRVTKAAKQMDHHSKISTLRKKFPDVVFHSGSSANKEVALTFDDGPDNHYTPEILDILKQSGVRATFFVIGVHAQTYPDILRRMVNEGHAIGNHTWDHPDLVTVSSEQIRSELNRTDDALDSILGYNPALFRPPFGAVSVRVVNQVASLGYKIIDWSVDTRDWTGAPPSVILQRVQAEVHPGGIILEHCAGGNVDLRNTVNALPQIISLLKKQGFQFVTVPDLLHIPVALEEQDGGR
jgi:peptidoglycan-N-acetylglucosamine deacetylase